MAERHGNRMTTKKRAKLLLFFQIYKYLAKKNQKNAFFAIFLAYVKKLLYLCTLF